MDVKFLLLPIFVLVLVSSFKQLWGMVGFGVQLVSSQRGTVPYFFRIIKSVFLSFVISISLVLAWWTGYNIIEFLSIIKP